MSRRTAGFSLIELLMVVAIMAIVAAVVLPNSNPSIHDQLMATARIVSADLACCRSLAVTYNSRYAVAFDVSGNRYVLRHTGTDASLNRLPDSPWHDPSATNEQYVVALDELPHLGVGVRIAAIGEADSAAVVVTDVEFGALGETTRRAETVIWLTAGDGSAQRYVSLSVNPVTGLVTTGPFTAEPPTSPTASPTL